ncbi:MAG: histidine phosphatase family protein [Patescibacteria group bacterium]
MKFNNQYYILRHGKAVSNEQRIVSSHPEKFENSLTDEGREQIKNVVVEIEKLNIDLIFASDLLRTKQTAEIIADTLKLEIIFDKRLREIDMGIFNGGPEDAWNEFYECEAQRFVKKPKDGGENYREVKERAKDFIGDIDKKYKGKNILIVSHGCVLFSMQVIVGGQTEEQEMSCRNNLVMKNGELKKLN